MIFLQFMMMQRNKKRNMAYWTRKTHLFRSDEFICSACGYPADKAYKQCPSCNSNMCKSKYDPSWVDEAEFLDIFLED